MTDTGKYKPVWQVFELRDAFLKQSQEDFAEATKEAVIAKYAELRAALYGTFYTLDALDSMGHSNGYSHGAKYATSDLFPLDLAEDGKDGEGKIYTTEYNMKDGKPDCYFVEGDPDWSGNQNYNKQESLSMACTTYIDDRVQILAAHEAALGAYVGGGVISFGDVRILRKVIGTSRLVLDEVADPNKYDKPSNTIEPSADTERLDAEKGNRKTV